jgi:hypothetical protein
VVDEPGDARAGGFVVVAEVAAQAVGVERREEVRAGRELLGCEARDVGGGEVLLDGGVARLELLDRARIDLVVDVLGEDERSAEQGE